MRLSELIPHLAPAIYTVIGLVLFIAVFAVIVVRTYWPSNAAAQERASRLPLEGDES